MYRDIFNHEFNLEFYKPKQDRCDKCESFKYNKDDEQNRHHVAGKISTILERDKDREKAKADRSEVNLTSCGLEAVICFELEHVLSCSRANVSNCFYKGKRLVYVAMICLTCYDFSY